MRITLLLGLRNLFRQKRRNFLLALIIAFGMSVLIMSGSTGDGMTDIMLNNMLVNWVGHIQVTIFEKMDKNGNIIRDRDKIMDILRGKTSITSKRLKRVSTSGPGLSATAGLPTSTLPA